MLLLALVVFGVTAWFMGVRAGGIASLVSLAMLIGAQVVPGSAMAIYALHILYIVGLVWVAPRFMKLFKKPEETGPAAAAKRWFKRSRAFGEALWKSQIKK